MLTIKQQILITQKAIEIFGETWSPSLCGFILEGGTMLNFSYNGDRRDRDHRDVGEAWIECGMDCPGGTESMTEFERMGHIRFSKYNDGCSITLNTYQEVTWAQWDAIRKACDGCEVWYDIYDNSESMVRSGTIDLAHGSWVSVLARDLKTEKMREV